MGPLDFFVQSKAITSFLTCWQSISLNSNFGPSVIEFRKFVYCSLHWASNLRALLSNWNKDYYSLYSIQRFGYGVIVHIKCFNQIRGVLNKLTIFFNRNITFCDTFIWTKGFAQVPKCISQGFPVGRTLSLSSKPSAIHYRSQSFVTWTPY